MNIEEAYESVKKFNKISGNLDSPDEASLALQLDIIQEEYTEGVDAFDAHDKVGLVDAACDMFVTVAGFMQKLDAQGYNVNKALSKVCENNLSKFTSYAGNKTNVWPTEYQAMFNDEYKVIVLRNKDGKIVKPSGFKPVDLSDCIPGEVS